MRIVPLIIVLGAALGACPRSNQNDVPAMAVPDPIVVRLDAAPAFDATSDALVRPSDAGPRDDADDAGNACNPSTWDRPLRELPCPSERFRGRRTGFSKTERVLTWCISTCDPCPLDCTFDDGRRQTSMSYFYAPGLEARLSGGQIEKLRAAQDKKLDDLLDRYALPSGGANRPPLRGAFPYDDLTFAAKVSPEDARGVSAVAFGARVSGETPVFPLQLEVGPHPMRGAPLPKEVRTQKERDEWNSQWTMGEPDLFVDVSADGKDLGLVAMASGSMWYEAAKSTRIGVSRFASQVYAGTAKAAVERSAFARAAELYGKAAAAEPAAWELSYEQAAAYARLHDARAEAALARAIQVGGAKARARAKADPVFAQEPWFGKR
jgi:hypothetical protein